MCTRYPISGSEEYVGGDINIVKKRVAKLLKNKEYIDQNMLAFRAGEIYYDEMDPYNIIDNQLELIKKGYEIISQVEKEGFSYSKKSKDRYNRNNNTSNTKPSTHFTNNVELKSVIQNLDKKLKKMELQIDNLVSDLEDVLRLKRKISNLCYKINK